MYYFDWVELALFGVAGLLLVGVIMYLMYLLWRSGQDYEKLEQENVRIKQEMRDKATQELAQVQGELSNLNDYVDELQRRYNKARIDLRATRAQLKSLAQQLKNTRHSLAVSRRRLTQLAQIGLPVGPSARKAQEYALAITEQAESPQP